MDLKTKLSDMIELVRSNPDNPQQRLIVIQYLCICAQWEQALKHIKQFQKLFPNVEKSLILFLIENIEAEMRRESTLTAKQKPKTFEQHASKLEVLQKQLSLVAHASEKESNLLLQTYTELVDLVPEIPISITYLLPNKSVETTSGKWVIDGDVRTSFVCEFFLNGQYYWQPWDSINSIAFIAPNSLLDIIWRPSEITFKDGKSIQCITPARYVVLQDLITKWSDALLQCSKTDWMGVAEDLFIGFGQKMLYTDKEDFGLLDIRLIKFGYSN
ncbi:type VI secretion system accessory protein TagJ [Neisseria zalophi]|uniref:ImpE protein n=1 Tax=Neisseria zalophi TaxID=640030 RepID=A0A5J6PTW4_9NEIS|nr:type VI secretion system accessory protein TagJ [Neisseria zalophi]QEY26148.1 ImpE protein [Neisseria zalophi]